MLVETLLSKKIQRWKVTNVELNVSIEVDALDGDDALIQAELEGGSRFEDPDALIVRRIKKPN